MAGERGNRVAYALAGALVVGLAAPFHYYVTRIDQTFWFIILAAMAAGTAAALLIAIASGRTWLCHAASGIAFTFYLAQILAVAIRPAVENAAMADRFAFAASNVVELAVAGLLWWATHPRHRLHVQ